jgi:hypothetical protein
MSVFFDITPCSPVKYNLRFGEIYRLDLQVEASSACRLLLIGFLLALLFDTEDRDDSFLQTVG